MKKITLITLTFFTFGFVTPKKKTIFIGTVISNEENKDYIAGLNIDFRIDTLVIAQNIVGEDRKFKISTYSDKEFDVFYRGLGIGENYATTIKPTEKDTLLFTIKIPRKYKKKQGNTICPKCSKHDQTVSIRYGLKAEIVYYQIDKKGDTLNVSSNKNNYYDGGCVHSDISAKYYCKRDKLKF